MRDPKSKFMPTQTNHSSEKLLALLEVMTEQPEPVRLQDIAQQCGMNASTALRFLTALQRRDYVAQDIDTGRYYLTFKICALSRNVAAYTNIRSISLPFLRSVANIFSESCNLAIENDMTVIYVEVANCPQKTLMSMQRIGNVAPLHCTGVGKLFLTQYSPQDMAKMIAVKKLARFTEYTITDPKELDAELETARKMGYAFDNQECEVGARCIAAPIRDYSGKISAAISVSGPSVRMTDRHIYTHLPVLLDAARQISIRMGWSGVADNSFN